MLVSVFGYSPTLGSASFNPPPLLPRNAEFTLTPLSVSPPYASAILVKDLRTGKAVFEFEANRRVAPASLTKIMSALVILDSEKLREPVLITREATSAPRIRLRVRKGDIFLLEDLLKAMLIKSANDACRAAAMHVGGSIEEFVEIMNQYTLRLGLRDTHFANPCGFDAPDHYSTARDLAQLTEIAMTNDAFRSIVNTQETKIRSLKRKRTYVLRNTNRLLRTMEGVEGVKTGFTSQAGRCVIAKVNYHGKELLLVLMHAKRRWQTATNLINYGLFQVGSPELTGRPDILSTPPFLRNVSSR